MTEEPATYTATKIPLQEQIDALRSQFQRLQDANLAPLLESSAVLVQLTRIADVLEAFGKSLYFDVNGDQYVYTGKGNETVERRGPQSRDCDELWRLARNYIESVASGGGPPRLQFDCFEGLKAYVREHS